MIAPTRKSPETIKMAEVYDITDLSSAEERALLRFLKREAGEEVNTDHARFCGTSAQVDLLILARALAKVLQRKDEE